MADTTETLFSRAKVEITVNVFLGCTSSSSSQPQPLSGAKLSLDHAGPVHRNHSPLQC